MNRPALALAAAAFLLAAPAGAQTIAGEWDASMETPGGTRTARLVLVVEGQKVTGTLKRETGEVPVAGTIVADTLRFAYTIQYNNSSLEMHVLALVAGDAIRGAVSFGEGGTMPWWAERVPAARRPEGKP